MIVASDSTPVVKYNEKKANKSLTEYCYQKPKSLSGPVNSCKMIIGNHSPKFFVSSLPQNTKRRINQKMKIAKHNLKKEKEKPVKR